MSTTTQPPPPPTPPTTPATTAPASTTTPPPKDPTPTGDAGAPRAGGSVAPVASGDQSNTVLADRTSPSGPPAPAGATASLPARTAPPMYPQMKDPGEVEGFVLTTNGSRFTWIGGDEGKVVLGDSRSIVNGEVITHVSGNRLAQIGGLNESHFYAGNKSVTHAFSNSTVVGPQTNRVQGNQDITILGNRYVYSQGRRTEINIAFRSDLWLGGRVEVGVGGKKELVGPFKFETILGIKHTSVLGAKIDHIKGTSITAGAASCKLTYPSLVMAIGGASIFNLTGGRCVLKSPGFKYEGDGMKIEAPKLEATGESIFKKAGKFLSELKVEKKFKAEDFVDLG